MRRLNFGDLLQFDLRFAISSDMTLLWRMLAIALFSVREASGASSWKTDHSVTGLPTLDEAPLTSYAGVVTVRKDHYTEVYR